MQILTYCNLFGYSVLIIFVLIKDYAIMLIIYLPWLCYTELFWNQMSRNYSLTMWYHFVVGLIKNTAVNVFLLLALLSLNLCFLCAYNYSNFVELHF